MVDLINKVTIKYRRKRRGGAHEVLTLEALPLKLLYVVPYDDTIKTWCAQVHDLKWNDIKLIPMKNIISWA